MKLIIAVGSVPTLNCIFLAVRQIRLSAPFTQPSVDKNSTRPLIAAAAILSVFVAGCLLPGAPLVNAQADEHDELEVRIARIEGILEQMNERLVELNHLGDKIDVLRSEFSVKFDAINSEIHSGNRNLLIAIVSVILLSPISNALSKKYILKEN